MIECEWIWDLGPTGRQLWRIKRHGRLNHSSRLFRIQQWKAERTRGPRSGWWAIAAFWGFEGMSKNCCLHFFKVKNFILAQKDLFSLNGPTWSIGKEICSDETMTMALIAGASLCHRQPPRLECRSCHGLLCNPHPTGFPLTFLKLIGNYEITDQPPKPEMSRQMSSDSQCSSVSVCKKIVSAIHVSWDLAELRYFKYFGNKKPYQTPIFVWNVVKCFSSCKSQTLASRPLWSKAPG